MARRFQKLNEFDTLVAPDGDESPERETIVVGSKWEGYVSAGKLVEIAPDDSEELLPDDSNPLVSEEIIPPEGGVGLLELVGVRANHQLSFSGVLSNHPLTPSSVTVKSNTGGTVASKDFGSVAPGEYDATLQANLPGSIGNNIRVALTGNSTGSVYITRSLGVWTIHFRPGQSTVGQVNYAIAHQGLLPGLVVYDPGTENHVLSMSAGFLATNLAGGVDPTATDEGTDDGSGVITGANLTGTVNYGTGAIFLAFSALPHGSLSVSAEYTPVYSKLFLSTPLPHNNPLVMQNGAMLEHGPGPDKFTIDSMTSIRLGTYASGMDLYTVVFSQLASSSH